MLPCLRNQTLIIVQMVETSKNQITLLKRYTFINYENWHMKFMWQNPTIRYPFSILIIYRPTIMRAVQQISIMLSTTPHLTLILIVTRATIQIIEINVKQ